MGKVEKIEQKIKGLAPEEMAKFREWFAEFDAAAWEHQLEADIRSGKLDVLADQALNAHTAGKTNRF